MFIFRNARENMNYFNAGVPDQITVTQIAGIVCAEMGLHNVKFKYTGGSTGWLGDVPHYRYDLKKLNSLGWKAAHSSTEAVRLAVRSVLGK